jgi:hypothetical protein
MPDTVEISLYILQKLGVNQKALALIAATGSTELDNDREFHAL